jgi:hypothetical protein
VVVPLRFEGIRGLIRSGADFGDIQVVLLCSIRGYPWIIGEDIGILVSSKKEILFPNPESVNPLVSQCR